jgi:transcriptional regulator with XRE-family HTH domain
VIRNQREYAITKGQVGRLEASIKRLEATPPDARRVHPRLVEAEKKALAVSIQELRSSIRDYDSLVSGGAQVFAISSLSELPLGLIRARIALGLTQKDLADRLGLKEQQIQRYESSDYEAASLGRILEVANALGVSISQELVLPTHSLSLGGLVAAIGKAGFDKALLKNRVYPALFDSAPNGVEPQYFLRKEVGLLDRLSKILGVSSGTLLAQPTPQIELARLGVTGFRLPAGRAPQKTLAYVAYARYIATLAIKCVPQTELRLGSLAESSFSELVTGAGGYHPYDRILGYVWEAGIPVLPLDDSGAFSAATFQVSGRPLIALKQPIRSEARWLFDLLHEVYHATSTPQDRAATILDFDKPSLGSASLGEEEKANTFAGNILLGGRAEELARQCVDAAGKSVEHLKRVVPGVATSARVDSACLANYMAFRLSLQSINWWGAANNLQSFDVDPYRVARDIFLAQTDLSRVDNPEREMLVLALREVGRGP